MAIVQNMWLKKAKKKLGGTVLYVAMEQTRQRELAVDISNPRTPSQMRQRVKWSNLVNFYRVNREWMKYAFETKSAQQSEYNKFMSVNVSSSNIYLTKTLAGMGSCVVAPYIITQGSLTPVEITEGSGYWASNIYFTEGFNIGVSTTIGEFTAALLGVNPALRQGDQLSFIRFTQMSNTDTGAPYVIVRRYEVLLKQGSTELLGDYLPEDYITNQVLNGQDTLCVQDSGLAGGFALIISRTIGGKTYVSTQRIITAHNDAMISAYSSQAALDAAISSYGDGEDAFLSSNSAEEVNSAPVATAVLGITKDGSTFATGTQVDIGTWRGGDQLAVTFNGPLEATNINSAVVISGGSSYSCAATIEGNKVKLVLPNTWPASPSGYLSRVQVSLDGIQYNGVYNVPSGGGGQGDSD